ncbi:hypothetical protein HUZ36_17755 [Pseudoalteromonas sp. McH1-7]|uniref:Ig-like domain-containing protein n=1 Tax=Pseudoalteromonas peptidolytica F12-50-A1 TaxID=1315280 RepID=A0A8I0T8F3_9GAMM|nr:MULTISPECIES: hypothetical protein [Pseudoalteromonas]MBE0349249.1 hypothetical protein [Pseudoalteromonas peptidolytica F12-50-A1]MDW7549054.1 hypothetical protein [Pseudoalteromonas peptidolytica]NLR16467.1 hypothetical protein [Pseudoalteromonas peptidolytica]NUZ12630.1 hypothetical protein [Pseudoalteromonas sp. McH1-7]RXE99024.1 hypothetical protein D9603_16645 [Pseudoalteromonas sp. PS5]
MKKFCFALSLAAVFVSANSMALPSLAHDTDGFERVTEYTNGPVATAILASEFAHNLKVDLHPRGEGDFCSYANVYHHTTGEQIAHANVQGLSGSNYVQQATATIPEQYLTANKRVEVSCTSASGEQYDVYVNVPGAPLVEWEINAQPAGEFVHRPNTYGYHSAYHVESRLSVDSQSNSGRCTTLSNRGVELGLFHGESGKGPFHSDVFMTDITVDNSQAGQPVLYQIIECENAAGKTLAVKVLSLTNPNSINVIHEEHVIK